MLPFLAGLPHLLQIVPSPPKLRLAQFGRLEFRGSFHESVPEDEDSSRVGEVKNSDFVLAILRALANPPSSLR